MYASAFWPSGFTRTNAIAEDLLQSFWWRCARFERSEKGSAGFCVVGSRPVNVRHQFLVFGKEFAPQTSGGKLIWAVIGRSSASSNRLFQGCEKSLADLASFHVFLQLHAERIIEFFIEIVGKLREHLLTITFTRMQPSSCRSPLWLGANVVPRCFWLAPFERIGALGATVHESCPGGGP